MAWPSQLVVDNNGAVFLGNVTELGDLYNLTGSVVWYQDLDPSIANKIYVANVDGVLVISWEGVPQNCGLPENGRNFQVALYPGGNIEIRWGDGNPPTDRDARGFAGIFDESAGVVVPATRFPFGNNADGNGRAPSFPSNQCRTFVATALGNYIELP